MRRLQDKYSITRSGSARPKIDPQHVEIAAYFKWLNGGCKWGRSQPEIDAEYQLAEAELRMSLA